MRRIFSGVALLLLSLFISGCVTMQQTTYNHAKVPFAEKEFNNCIAIKIALTSQMTGTMDPPFQHIYFMNGQGEEYAATRFEQDGYYYLFNVPKGTYKAIRAEYRDVEERKGRDKRTLMIYEFDKNFKTRSTIKIRNNQFKFIGFYTLKGKFPNGKELMSNLAGGLVSEMLTGTQEMSVKTSVDSAVTRNDECTGYYNYMNTKFSGTPWADLIKKEYKAYLAE